MDHKKRTRNGRDYGLLEPDAQTACRIANWEGIMHCSAKDRYSEEYSHYQGMIRKIFASEKIPLPKELEMGYRPIIGGWSEGK